MVCLRKTVRVKLIYSLNRAGEKFQNQFLDLFTVSGKKLVEEIDINKVNKEELPGAPPGG